MRGTRPARRLHDAYALAQERYAATRVGRAGALATLGIIALSLIGCHGNDFVDFE